MPFFFRKTCTILGELKSHASGSLLLLRCIMLLPLLLSCLAEIKAEPSREPFLFSFSLFSFLCSLLPSRLLF